MKKNKQFFLCIISKLYHYKYLCLTLFACGIYAGIMFNQTMPYAEGWYTYYAKCINNGQVAYRDFDYLFPPLYMYLIALFTRVFGYKLISLRIFGILIYCLIALFIYLGIKEAYNEKIALISTLVAVLYLQSEKVQTFYDYVRVMDCFAALSMYLLVRFVKKAKESGKNTKHIALLLGFSLSGFTLVKQNMGLVAFAYVLFFLLVYFTISRKPLKVVISNLMLLFGGYIIPIFFTAFLMFTNGSLAAFLNQVGGEALAAKGGFLAILFNWIPNNLSGFSYGISFAFRFLVVLVICAFLRNKVGNTYYKLKYLPEIFAIFCAISFIAFAKCEKLARYFDGHDTLSPFSVFLIVVPIFLYFVIKVVIRFFRKEQISEESYIFIAISGMYLAISWGCGMSGGLVEGQATIGVACAVGLLLYQMRFKYSDIISCFIIGISLLLTLQCSAKKMIYTYNWWGMDEATFWESRAQTDKIELLEGIGMSVETVEVYETIYDIVKQNTVETDTIYCFPQIPSFYYLCNREDPGVRAKVQWFDVASDKSIDHDMRIIAENPPKVILIYNSSEQAYDAHEFMFRDGQVSATRRMKQFLVDFSAQHGYTYIGKLSSTSNNSISVYCKMDDDWSLRYDFEGEGTLESPYSISTVDDLHDLREAVVNGNSFDGKYFIQENDIDLSKDDVWIPIGEFDSGCYFAGIYNGNGYTIKNLNYDDTGNGGLFGQLAGKVINLGIVDCKVNGDCVGAISSHAAGDRAAIINCYVTGDISGHRAGAIADNFPGKVLNCITYATCHGETAGAISYEGCTVVDNVYALADNIQSGIVGSQGDQRVKYCTTEFLSGLSVLDYLNNYSCDEETLAEVDLVSWETGEEGFPILKK